MFKEAATLTALISLLGCVSPGLESARKAAPETITQSTALHARGVPTLTRAGDVYIVSIPGVGWTMQFPAGDLVVAEVDTSTANYFHLLDENTVKNPGVEPKAETYRWVSFWVDDAAKCRNDARTCRDDRWAYQEEKSPVPVQEPRFFEMGQWSLVEFTMPVRKLSSKTSYHLFAEHVRDGVWIDFHMSKLYDGDKERQIFVNFLNTVEFVPSVPSK